MTPERHQRIKEVFLEACGLPVERRSQFLDGVCAGDDELRHHVELLLAQHLPSQLTSDSDSLDAPFEKDRGPGTRNVGPERKPHSLQKPSSWSAPDEAGVFQSGQVIAERYRIVALLGRGGMGVVYRAEDLKLGQTVALKFLSTERSRDSAWLERFRQEVRLAREVTHPNVCRVHDIGETDGRAFISMEYVDGENLGTLLKRIGRLPGDKAIDIARQLCAGLAAAHVRGVLHRDLKPANVMLDGRGKVRITDFGLAGLTGNIAKSEIRAGTPRYMAPEQLAGTAVSEASDIYSLGLVLYELFTGQAAFDARSVGEYRHVHEHSDPSLPSSLVADLDPEVERVILACLRKNPNARPESALAVAAALPGGDLLAAALAMGETPSPEMVAAAGATEPVRIARILGAVVGFIALLALLVAPGARMHLIARAGAEKAPEVLAERAREVIEALGYERRPLDYAYGFTSDVGIRSIPEQVKGDPPASPQLAVRGVIDLAFWYRQSAEHLIPAAAHNVVFSNARISRSDPPANGVGMVTVLLDADGRLILFEANAPAGITSKQDASKPVWEKILKIAGFNAADLVATEPRFVPSSYADARAAWIGSDTHHQAGPIRIEAAAYRNQPVMFIVLDDSAHPRGASAKPANARRIAIQNRRDSVLFLLILVAVPVAWHNLRVGRSDKKGAVRSGAFVLGLRMLVWLFEAPHVPEPFAETQLLLFAGLGAMAEAVLVWTFYLALEPYVRRFWPQTIIAWSRVLAGRLRDPLVGWHIAVGGIVGTFWALMFKLDAVAPAWLGLEVRDQLRIQDELSHLLGPRLGLAKCLDCLRGGVYQGVLLLLLVVLLRLILRRPRLAALTAVILIAPMYVPIGSHSILSWVFVGIGCVAVAVWLFARLGLVAVASAIFVAKLLTVFPITLDFKLWYADISLFALMVAVGTVALGLWIARAGLPVIQDPHSHARRSL